MASTTPTPEAEEAGRYTCPLCPGRFESVGDKRRHIRTSHPKERSKR